MKIFIPEYVKTLVPYKSGNMIAKNTDTKSFDKLINLASNENPLGPSPEAIKAIQIALTNLAHYPDTRSAELVSHIAAKHNCSSDMVFCGSGSDSIIAYLINAFTDIEDEIITAMGTFIGIYTSSHKQGRNVIKTKLKNYGFDLDAMLKCITPKTKMIYLANPNNPTGTLILKEEFEEFMAKVPENILVIFDEAYYEYSRHHANYPNGLDYISKYDNLIVLRTLSKILGLAGIRIGYSISNKDITHTLFKVKLPFEPNTLAQKAAIAAIIDYEFIDKTSELNQRMMEEFEQFLIKYKFNFIKGFANFHTILFENEDIANEFTAHCLDHGIIVRPLASFGMNNGVRISTGTETQMQLAYSVFEKYINI